MLKRFSPQWLRSFTDYMSVYERKAKNGRPTYALGIDEGGTTFPTFVIKDVPIWCVKEYVGDVKRGWRILRQMSIRGVHVDYTDLLPGYVPAIEKQAELGRKCRPVEERIEP